MTVFYDRRGFTVKDSDFVHYYPIHDWFHRPRDATEVCCPEMVNHVAGKLLEVTGLLLAPFWYLLVTDHHDGVGGGAYGFGNGLDW
jgi:hypothetical protein